MEFSMGKFRSKFDTLNPHLRHVHNLGQIEVELKYINVKKSAIVGDRNNIYSNDHLPNTYQRLVSEAASRNCTLERRMKIRKELSEIRRQKREDKFS